MSQKMTASFLAQPEIFLDRGAHKTSCHPDSHSRLWLAGLPAVCWLAQQRKEQEAPLSLPLIISKSGTKHTLNNTHHGYTHHQLLHPNCRQIHALTPAGL